MVHGRVINQMCEGSFDGLHGKLETKSSGESERPRLLAILEYLVRF